MVRKKQTYSAGDESSQSHDTSFGSGRGSQRPPQQLGRGGGGGRYSGGGRGWVPRSPQAGRGGYVGGRGCGRGGYVGGRAGHGSRGVPSPSGPSRPHVPEPHQATEPFETAVTPQPAPSEAGSSSRPPEHVPLTEQLQQLSIKQEVCLAIQPVPPPSKSLRFPGRPGMGCEGRKYEVKANHFFAKFANKEVHKYDVTITPELTLRRVNREVMAQLVRQYRSDLGERYPAYDGRKSLYTAVSLPFDSREFDITIVGVDRREREFKVVIKWVARHDLHRLRQFLQGDQVDVPQEALQALDIVLRELPATKDGYCPVDRSFHFRDELRTTDLGQGLESWPGFFQSIRPTQMGLSLNIDMSSTAFIRPLPVTEFVENLLPRNVSSGPLRDADLAMIKKALLGVKVEVTQGQRKFRISGLTSQATGQLTFLENKTGRVRYVVEYFKETHGNTIERTQWPCLQVGSQQRPIYLPMEVCKIVKGQRYSKRLNETQIAALLKVTCQRPKDRADDILKTVEENDYGDDNCANDFGIIITKELALVKARILPAPLLKYHDTGREKDCLPTAGKWSMMQKKMVNGGTVKNWICIDFSCKGPSTLAQEFCSQLAGTCRTYGMMRAFNSKPVIPPFNAGRDQVEKALKEQYRDAMTKLQQKNNELDLLIAILPDNNGSLYGDLKRICETDIGIVSQCCLSKHASQMKKQYLTNVALKINVKVGGRNTVLAAARPPVSEGRTIIFGADVTHPSPGEDSSPSIAAVVASQDWPQITKYAALVCSQAHRVELIQDLYKTSQDPVRGTVSGGMIREHLISFQRANGGQLPERIIFYRDGVSEGQFSQVLEHELDDIRKACASLEPNYKPPVTFIVVQKRHHTRLFPSGKFVNQSGNISPGTVVDSGICHPTEFDFYLCSHAGIMGTSRPAHYHVLWDDNKFTADQLQSLTYNLCYTYARCTRSVSIVPPAYYAHLAAFRARFYMERVTSESGSRPGSSRGRRGPDASPDIRPLPTIRENVKRVMFYC